MTAKKKTGCCDVTAGCCRVETMVTVDERGQMVLPKDLRERANIGPGEKFVVVSMQKDGEVCCFSLIKADSFNDMVKGFLGPMLGDIIGK